MPHTENSQQVHVHRLERNEALLSSVTVSSTLHVNGRLSLDTGKGTLGM